MSGADKSKLLELWDAFQRDSFQHIIILLSWVTVYMLQSATVP